MRVLPRAALRSVLLAVRRACLEPDALTLRHFLVHTVAHELLHVDGALWRTLRLLFVRPRTLGAAISPLFVGFMFARPDLINLPFFIAGTLKIVYDLMLYREFVAVQPPEEMLKLESQ